VIRGAIKFGFEVLVSLAAGVALAVAVVGQGGGDVDARQRVDGLAAMTGVM